MTDPVVTIPAVIDVEDRLVGPVTFRMASWLAAAGAGAALLAASRHAPILIPAGVLLLAAGMLGAFWRPAGRPAPAWLAPACNYRRRRRFASTTGVTGWVPPEETVAAPPSAPAGRRATAAALFSLFAAVVLAAAAGRAVAVRTAPPEARALPAAVPSASPTPEEPRAQARTCVAR